MLDPYPFLFGAVLLFTAIHLAPAVVRYVRKNVSTGTGDVDSDLYMETERKIDNKKA